MKQVQRHKGLFNVQFIKINFKLLKVLWLKTISSFKVPFSFPIFYTVRLILLFLSLLICNGYKKKH